MYRHALLMSFANSASRGFRWTIFGAIFAKRFAAVSSAAGVVPLTICGSVCSSVTALPCTTRSGQNATFVVRPRALR